MGNNEAQANMWWSYLGEKERLAVIEMVYRMTTEDMEAHGLYLNDNEELYWRDNNEVPDEVDKPL